MGRNSHNPSIDETPKPFSKKLTQEQYEIAVGLRCPECGQPYQGGCDCKSRRRK